MKARYPEARVIARRAGDARRRCTAALAAGHSVPVTPQSAADALNAPFAGENCLEICRALGVESVLVSEDELVEAFRWLYARTKFAVRARRRRLDGGAPLGQGAGRARPDRRRRGLGRQRRCKTGRCYPGFMKADIHPEYVLATVTCSCGNTFQTRSTKPELHVEICSNCHPFYTGKQKLMDTGGRVERFQKRLERAERAKRGASR